MIACGPSESGDAGADSAYAASLGRWLKDSAAVDSVSRTIPLDSYEVLTYAMGDSATHAVAVQERACERSRLSVRFGFAPTDVAIDRWSKRFDASHPALRGVIDGLRVPGSAVTIGPKPCGIADSAWSASAGKPYWSLHDRPHPMR